MRRSGLSICICLVGTSMMLSCSLEEVCQDGELICKVCSDEKCGEETGEVYRESRYARYGYETSGDKTCIKYQCLSGIFEPITSNNPENDICQKGFNGSSKLCAPECMDGQVKCVKTDDTKGESCKIQVCEKEKWQSKDDICEKGFDKDKGVCLESDDCMLNTTQKVPKTIDCRDITKCSAMLQVCKPEPSNKWVYRWTDMASCEFGFVDDRSETTSCIDPCSFKGQNQYVLYDEGNKRYYACDMNGWRETSCGGVDYNDIGVLSDAETKIFKNFVSHEIPENVLSTIGDEIHYGACGKCSRDSSPEYCIKDENEDYISHRCENGLIKVVESSEQCAEQIKKKELSLCTDNYGQSVYVNTDNNRYHCGNCGNVCSTNESCSEGVCKSPYDCAEGEFVRVDIGTRWVNALCVRSVDKLKNIRDDLNKGQHYPSDNYDNAYILATDLDVGNDWRPIGNKENPFKGVFFGNNHTITIGTITPGLFMGLFGYADGSVIESLNLMTKAENTIQLSEGTESVEVYFGLLAGLLNDSIIKNVHLSSVDKAIEQKIVLTANAFCNADSKCRSAKFPPTTDYYIGSMIGLFRNKIKPADLESSSVDGVGFNLSVRDGDKNLINKCCKDDENVEATDVYLGGMVGRISGFQEDSESDGGIDQRIAFRNNVIKNVSVKSDNIYNWHNRFRVGGAIGSVEIAELYGVDLLAIDILTGVAVNRIAAGGLVGHADHAHMDTIILDLIKIKSRNRSTTTITGIGGAVGVLTDSSMNNIHVCENSDDCSVVGYHKTGGMVGYSYVTDTLVNSSITDASVKMKYVGDGISVDDRINGSNYEDDFFNRIGGAIGMSANTNIDSVKAIIDKIEGGYEVGGFIGYMNNSWVSMCDVDVKEYAVGSYYVGGFTGLAQDSNIQNSTTRFGDLKTYYSIHMCGTSSEDTSDNGCCNYKQEDGKTMNVCCGKDSSYCGFAIGGFVGRANGVSILRCSVEGNAITENHHIGGFIGCVYNGKVMNSNVSYSSATVRTLKGTYYTGGFIGYVGNKVHLDIDHSTSVFKESTGNGWSNGSFIGFVYLDNPHVNLHYTSAIGTMNCQDKTNVCGEWVLDNDHDSINRSREHGNDNYIVVYRNKGSSGVLSFQDSVEHQLLCIDDSGNVKPIPVNLDFCRVYNKPLCCQDNGGENGCLNPSSCEHKDYCCNDTTVPGSGMCDFECDRILNADWVYLKDNNNVYNMNACSKKQYKAFFDPKNECKTGSTKVECKLIDMLPEDISLPANILEQSFNKYEPYVVRPAFCQ